MKNIGLLVTKNEASILEETLRANTRYIKDIFVLWGGNDGSEHVLKRCNEVKFIIHEDEILSKAEKMNGSGNSDRPLIKDGIRGMILDEILRHHNVGDWITLMHGDEIFYHDPNAAAAVASETGYNTIIWFALHFFLTKSDLEDWDRLKEKSLEEKITWYATNEYPWTECRQFKILPDTHYVLNTHSRTAPESENIKILPSPPVFKHYKVWDPNPDLYELVYSEKYKKIISKEKGKWGILPWEIRNFEDFFIDFYPGYHEKHQFVHNCGSFEEHFNDTLLQFNQYLRKKRLKISDIIENVDLNGNE